MFDTLFFALAFLQVISGSNVALNKPAYASTKFPHDPFGEPEVVVDGNLDNDVASESCFSTDHDDMSPWLVIDLLKSYVIDSVTITSRGDNLFIRMSHFRIEVFKMKPECPKAEPELCLTSEDAVVGTETLTCERKVRGRYLKVSKYFMDDKKDTLSFCEIQVAATSGWVRYQRFPNVQKPSLRVAVISPSPGHCARTCAEDQSCVSFNYRRAQPQCELVHQDYPAAPIPHPLSDYYGNGEC